MRTRIGTRLAPLVLLAGLAVGCSDSSTGPSAGSLDLPSLFAEMSAPGMPSLAPLTGAATASIPESAGLSSVPAGCSYDGASRSFVCPTVTRDGLTITESYFLYDAQGNPQAQGSSATTAAIRLVTHVSGTLSFPTTAGGGPVSVDTHQDVTLSGLLAGPHVLDGNSTTTMDGSFSLRGSTPVPLHTTSAQTISKLVLPARGAASRWPTSGTVTIDVTASGFGGDPLTTHLVTVFNGTSQAAVTLVFGDVTEHCTVDLSGKAMPVCTAG